ncbi:MAG TPA: TonB-dependent receptor, partial [Myxococcota bacterium]|nr:TonB-dependent receptor [Myxococcota bacterium]
LEAQAVQNVGDLSTVTPNLEIRQNSATQATFFIRGVGLQDFGPNATSAVAISQDGVGVNTAPLQLGQIFDAGSVDVLRGPQGTGAYRNGSAGAIVITSRKPEFDFQSYVRARFGTWAPSVEGARQGLIQDYEGALNVPVVEDVLAARLSFRVRQAEPYKVNGCGDALPFSERVPRPPGLSTDPGAASQCGEKATVNFRGGSISPIPEGLPDLFGEEDNWAGRGLLLFRPPDTEMEWLLNVHGSRLDQQPVVGQAMGTGNFPNANSQSNLGGLVDGNFPEVSYREPDQKQRFDVLCGPLTPQGGCTNTDAGEQLARELARNLDGRPFRGDFNREGRTRLETWGINLSGTVPLLDGRFTSLELGVLSGFDTYERFQNRDTDNTPEVIFESVDEDEAKQLWQELTLNGELVDLPISWNLGAYYFYEDLEADLLLVLPFNQALPFPADFFGITREFEQETHSVGAWAGLDWMLSERFTLNAGVRYNWEDKTFDLTRTQRNRSQFVSQAEVFEEWTGTVSLEHAFTEDISWTLKYSHGFKPGTFNAGVSATAQTDPVDPETVDSFEGILSADLWQGRIALRAEIFYYLYENYQVFLFSDPPSGPPVLEIQNAAEVENYGADVDLTVRPLEAIVSPRYENLKLNLRFGWLESQFIDFTNRRLFENALGQVIPVTVDFSGNRLPNSPRFSISGSVEWPLDLGRFGEIVPRYDFSFTDDTFFDAEEGRGNVRFTGENVLPEHTIGQRAFILHNLRLTYRPPGGRLEVAGWIRNILDTRYKTFAFDASQFSKVVLNNVGPPRTIGADVKLIF